MPQPPYTPLSKVPGPAWTVFMVLGTQLLGAGFLGFWHWNLFSGLLFSALWLSPRARWPWIVLGTGLGYTLGGLRVAAFSDAASFYSPAALEAPMHTAWMLFVGCWADPLLCLLPVMWLQNRLASQDEVMGTRGITLLHLAVGAAAILQTLTDIAWVLGEGFVADVRHGRIVDIVAITAGNASELLGEFALKNGLGYFLGTILVASFLFWLPTPRLPKSARVVWSEIALWLVPAGLVFIALVAAFPGSKLAELLRLLLILSLVVFSARHGLRGAAFSILVASICLAVEDHLGVASQSPVWMQMFVAIAGAMALLFGASMDALRSNARELVLARNAQARIARELVEAASRNVRAQEVERGRLALELHDSLGQGITALQTTLKLVQLDHHDRPPIWLPELRTISGQMRRSLGEVLEALRPAALVELGLCKALDRGVIRDMAERAGLAFHLRHGPIPALDEAASVAAFRIAQESVSNVVRHARAKEVRVQIRCRHGRHGGLLFLRVDDDGVGPRNIVPGTGLRGLRDRALTLGGDLRVRARPGGGTRVSAWFPLGQPGTSVPI